MDPKTMEYHLENNICFITCITAGEVNGEANCVKPADAFDSVTCVACEHLGLSATMPIKQWYGHWQSKHKGLAYCTGWLSLAESVKALYLYIYL